MKSIQILFDLEIIFLNKVEEEIIGLMVNFTISFGNGEGYYDSPKAKSPEGESLLDKTIEALRLFFTNIWFNQNRKEVESCDYFSGCVVSHSIGGGTGSGLGSHIIEEIRTNYPLNHILSISIVPFATGESPLQNYNSLLTLTWLQK